MTLLEVLRRFRPQWALLVVLTGLSVAGATLDAASVVLVVAMAESVSKGAARFSRQVGPIQVDLSIGVLAALTILAVVGSVGSVLLANVLRTRATARWVTVRRADLLTAFLHAPWSEQSKDRSGALQANLGYIGYASGIIGSLASLVRGLSGVAILIGSAVLISPIAALGILLLGSLLFLVIRPLNEMVKRRSYESNRLTKTISEDFGEASELAREVRLFGVTAAFEARVADTIEDLRLAEQKVGIWSSAVTPLYQGLALTVIVVALALSSSLGSVDVAVLGAVALLVLRSVSYGQQFQTSLTAVHQASPALDVIDAAVDELRRSAPDHGDEELTGLVDLELRHASYAYGGGEAALADVTVGFRSGEIVGVIGPSGAGKSTLAHVLLRLLELDGGEAVINGKPFSAFSDESWARQVALVPQEPFLMHGTMHDNIAFFRQNIGREAVVRAAKAAGIHETIERLDDGYDTPVGKSIRNLSGGQVQRLGIARALAGDPSMIVLDEPTSALDQHSEAVVQTTLESLRGRALVVVVAHRLTTLSICDRVIVMNQGRVEADGDLANVMEQSSFFRSAVEQLALASGGTLPGG